uniref:Pentacotripeptide-repeat region of PRORP domain-containing protein n=1 Tax=Chromera velia CCMP2878 TaxID=1169474 RepID=A0A0G4GU46_9ALVE|eukprot:Cvel_748.t1-p1 / transcript=Cvel_748.t1 / gene=Cvel_748 / organism=Chromera_velia_CCMP2878 / gene_product=Pentatricopeptide repeat-containing protein, putative / transcript_product=Pentatricopeptide repeat-containing protein, putative / location=Cvel_scaffold23:79689-87223(+) / protein_length=1281 / sequence_SO=supercontig / SO=protein_coding / is_pseudo=false
MTTQTTDTDVCVEITPNDGTASGKKAKKGKLATRNAKKRAKKQQTQEESQMTSSREVRQEEENEASPCQTTNDANAQTKDTNTEGRSTRDQDEVEDKTERKKENPKAKCEISNQTEGQTQNSTFNPLPPTASTQSQTQTISLSSLSQQRQDNEAPNVDTQTKVLLLPSHNAKDRNSSTQAKTTEAADDDEVRLVFRNTSPLSLQPAFGVSSFLNAPSNPPSPLKPQPPTPHNKKQTAKSPLATRPPQIQSAPKPQEEAMSCRFPSTPVSSLPASCADSTPTPRQTHSIAGSDRPRSQHSSAPIDSGGVSVSVTGSSSIGNFHSMHRWGTHGSSTAASSTVRPSEAVAEMERMIRAGNFPRATMLLEDLCTRGNGSRRVFAVAVRSFVGAGALREAEAALRLMRQGGSGRTLSVRGSGESLRDSHSMTGSEKSHQKEQQGGGLSDLGLHSLLGGALVESGQKQRATWVLEAAVKVAAGDPDPAVSHVMFALRSCGAVGRLDLGLCLLENLEAGGKPCGTLVWNSFIDLAVTNKEPFRAVAAFEKMKLFAAAAAARSTGTSESNEGRQTSAEGSELSAVQSTHSAAQNQKSSSSSSSTKVSVSGQGKSRGGKGKDRNNKERDNKDGRAGGDRNDARCTPDAVTFNTLVRAKSQMKDVNGALALLDEMQSCGVAPNAVTFNSLIHACVNNRQMDKAARVLEEMRQSRLQPDKITYATLISGIKLDKTGCALRNGFDCLEELRAQGVVLDEVLYNSLMDACVHCGAVGDAERLFHQMKKEGICPSAVAFSIVMKGLGRCGRLDAAVNYLSEMDASGVAANAVIFGCLIDSALKSHRTDVADVLFEEMKMRGIDHTLVTCTLLIKRYGFSKDLDAAMQVLRQMCAQGIQPSSVTFNALLDTAVRSGRTDAVAPILRELESQGLSADVVTFSIICKGLCQIGNLEAAFDTLEKMKAINCQPDEILFNSLIDGCASAGKPELALKVLDDMKASKIRPSAVTFSILAKAFGESGQLERSIRVLDMLNSAGLINSRPVYATIFQCVLNHNKMVPWGEIAYSRMRSEGVRPDGSIFGMLISGFCQQGNAERAVAMVRDAAMERIQLTSWTYASLLRFLSQGPLSAVDARRNLSAEVRQIRQVQGVNDEVPRRSGGHSGGGGGLAKRKAAAGGGNNNGMRPRSNFNGPFQGPHNLGGAPIETQGGPRMTNGFPQPSTPNTTNRPFHFPATQGGLSKPSNFPRGSQCPPTQSAPQPRPLSPPPGLGLPGRTQKKPPGASLFNSNTTTKNLRGC